MVIEGRALRQRANSMSLAAVATLAGVCGIVAPFALRAQTSTTSHGQTAIPPASRSVRQPEGVSLDPGAVLRTGSAVSEHSSQSQPHLLSWLDGPRSKLATNGVVLDLDYLSDLQLNLRSPERQRAIVVTVITGVLNVDLGQKAPFKWTSIHIEGFFRTGASEGNYLHALALSASSEGPSQFRLATWWIEQDMHGRRLVLRLGQFAAEDMYGSQLNSPSFILYPLGYAMGNLFNTDEPIAPIGTPSLELRFNAPRHLYVKGLVTAADRHPSATNPNGLVPTFKGPIMGVFEVGYTPGQSSNKAPLTSLVTDRPGYKGEYRFGAAYNPGRFLSQPTGRFVSGSYLVYGMANQSLWRVQRTSARGIDGTFAVNWTPPDRSSNNSELTAGLRANEPFHIPLHNTVSLGFVRSALSSVYPATNSESKGKAEHALELSMLFETPHSLVLQPFVERYLNIGGSSSSASVIGIRTRLSF